MAPRTGSPQNDRSATVPQSGRLAIAFQEPLTAVLRIKNAQTAEVRAWLMKEIEKSVEQARHHGYSADDCDRAKFALVAFLDEAALYSENAALANWRSVQAELYKSEDAGERFFAYLNEIQRRGNTSETADLLEIYAQCLLLGFEGKYRLGRWGDDSSRHSSIPALLASVTAQIQKIRQHDEYVRPWRLRGAGSIAPPSDPWLKRLIFVLVFLMVSLVLLYIAFGSSLRTGLDQVQVAVNSLRR